jgi:hypothetical protein
MSPVAIHDQVARIQNSRAFAGKGQLKKLLEFLFLHIETQSTLKPDRVIRELWGSQCDSKSSADLASEMTRLRKALVSYYEDEGLNDEILINLPNRSATSMAGQPRWIKAELREPNLVEAALEEPAPKILDITPVPPRILPATFRLRFLVAALIFVLGLTAALVLLVAKPFERNVPQLARLEASTLVVLNSQGKELWRKTFPKGFWREYYEPSLADRVWFGDLDGDGQPEVLFLYHPSVNPLSQTTTLICYSARGDERWRWKPGREMPELGGSPPTFRTVGLAVLQEKDRQRSRIVVSSYHIPYYPHQIAVVDPEGKTLGQYWHSGHLDYLKLADFDGDGRDEIIATGISNGYHQATLLVLDPDTLSGSSAEGERPEVQLRSDGPRHEKLRLLFPRSDLNQALLPYNQGMDFTVEPSRLRFSVMECTSQPYCYVWYEFGKDYELLSVTASDQFRAAHAAFYSVSKSEHTFGNEEEREFERIQCLTGCPSVLSSNMKR